jgi:hypothetical protein
MFDLMRMPHNNGNHASERRKQLRRPCPSSLDSWPDASSSKKEADLFGIDPIKNDMCPSGKMICV